MDDVKNQMAAGRPSKGVLAVVMLCIFMVMLDGSIVNVALPSIGESLRASFAVLQWIVLSYLVATSALILAMGRLGDILGKKALYVAGIAVFTAGSAICAVPWSSAWLISGRAVQGIGGAIVLALGPALVTELVAPSHRGKAFGMMGVAISLGLIVGPGLGGVIVSALGWNWIFAINVPVGIFAAMRGARDIPSTGAATREPFDLAGAVALGVGIASLVIAITGGDRSGMSAASVTSLWVVSACAFAAFAVIERKVEAPLVDLRIFESALFSASLAAAVVSSIALGGTLVLMPFYLQSVLALDVRAAGLLLAVTPVALAVIAPIAGRLNDRFGARRLVTSGLLLMAAGFYAVSTLTQFTTKAEYLLKYLVVVIGIGVFQTPNSATIMSAVRSTRTGIGAGLLSVSRLLGQAIGVAAISGVWAWRVASHAGMPPRDGPLRAPVDALVGGFHDVFLVLLAVMALAAAIAALGFRSGERVDVDERATAQRARGGS